MKLFLLQPATAFAARVNQASFVYPIGQVQYDTVTTGSFNNVLPNMTVYFGSSAGASDLGVSRARKLADSDTIFFGRSSQGTRYGEVNLADNCYLSVFYDWRVWPKIPYIDSDGNRFMDHDLDFATYGADSPPVASAGPAFAGTINPSTGLITVSFSASASFTTEPGATIAAYGWTVHDGTITVGTSTSSSITATFPAGFRYVTLGIADSNSQFSYCRVPVLAIDPDDDPCISNFMIERHGIGIEGQEMAVRVRESIPVGTYPDNTFCMLIDGEPASASDRTNVLFQGWAEQEPTEISAEPTATLRDVTLTLVDVAGRLKNLPGFSQVLENVASPAKWGEMASPNMDRFMHFLLQWQSTALDVADFTWSGTTTTYPFKILSSEGASLWEQVTRKAQALVPEYRLTCNTRGQLRVIVDPMLQPVADRTSTVQVTLDAGDYSDLRYTQQRHPRTHWLRANAIVANASTVSAVFAIAPGEAPGIGEGESTDGENLVVSQAALNAYAGHKYARMNAPQGLFSLALAAGSTQGIQPSDLTWVRLTLPSSVAAQRGLAFTNERGLVHDLEVRYQSTRAALLRTVTLRWEREVSGISAVTVTIPTADPVDDGDWNTAPVAPPPFNNGLTGGDTLAFIDQDGLIFTTSNFTAATPTWTRNSTAVGAVGPLTLKGFVVDPFSPGYRGTGTAIRAYVLSNTALWRINDIFGTPSYTQLTTFAESIGNSGEHGSIAASFGRFFSVEAENPWIIGAQSHRSSGGQNGVYLKWSDDAGAAWSSEIRPSTFTQTISSNQGTAIVGLWLSPRTPGFALVGSYSASGSTPTGNLYKTTDWGATWSLASEYGVSFGVGLGACFHVPWQDNSDEDILYYGYWDRLSSVFNYQLHRSVGGVSSDISPVVSSVKYGPLRNNFGVRSLDTNRQQMVLVGFGNNADRVDPGGAGAVAKVGVFVSADGGSTWTLRGSTVTASGNANWPYQAAFAAGNANILYVWGNDGYIAYSTDNGVSFANKEPTNVTNSTKEILGICGGPTA